MQKIDKSIDNEFNKEVGIMEILREFYNIRDIGMGMIIALKRICELFEISASTIAIRNDIQNKFVKIFEYDIHTELDVFHDIIDITKNYSNINSNIDTDIVEKIFIDLFKDNNFYYTKDYKSVEDIFTQLDYTTDASNVKEIYTHYTKVGDYFSYVLLEKRLDTEYFTDHEITLLTTFCNIVQTRIKQTEINKLLISENNLKNAIIQSENMPVSMVEQNTYRILWYNNLYTQIMPNIKKGAICYELLGKDKPCEACCIHETLIEKNKHDNNKYWLKKSVPFTMGNGVPVHLIYAKNTDDYLNQLDYIDLLTSALSLKGLEEHYKRVIKKNNSDYILVTLDIDKFKVINQRYGTTIGNSILEDMADIIKTSLKDEEMFCRIHGDVFAIIFKNESEEVSNIRFNELEAKFKKMKEKYFVDKILRITSGVVNIDKNLDFNILLDRSNLARKSVKGSHLTSVGIYSEDIENKFQKEIKIEDRILYAVENEEFIPYLQAKFDMNTREICGAEALVRWITPDGMIYPDEFIPVFENNGFITTLDFIVYRKTMKFIRKCLDSNLKVYPISLNVSRNHITDKFFIAKFMNLVETYRIPLELIELEITESVFVEDDNSLKEFVDIIKEKNIKVSIDDFGTAYSSLHLLTDINIDVLKIDKSFIKNIDAKNANNKEKILLKAIIDLAKNLNFKVICEGVETDEQIEILKKIGCDYGQGYVFARPIPLEDYESKFLNK